MFKRFLNLGLLIALFAAPSVHSQLAEDSWSIGFGFTFPRYFSSDLRPLETNYGGFISVKRNFSENVALRLSGFYYNIEGRVPGGIYFYNNGAVVPSKTEEIPNTLMGGNLDFLYYFSPCHGVSPYGFFGFGGLQFDPDWSGIVNAQAESKITAQINLGIGAEWSLGADWKINTEVAYHSTDGGIDGIINNNRQGIFGSNADGYLAAELGFQFYFSKGQPSKYCQIYEGLSAEMPNLDNLATKNDVEEIVQRYIPREVVREVVVEKPVVSADRSYNKWVLIGVNFDTGSAKLRPEAYPVLLHALQVLLLNPGLTVEIQGFTDNVGTERSNQKLSERRALTVKNYLVGHGVASNKLKTMGYGESNPIASNNTGNGRAMNRRIEFKILK